jgi:hypothetical protein
MALRLIEGFDHYNTVAQMVSKGWTHYYGDAPVSGRFDGRAAVVQIDSGYWHHTVPGTLASTMYFGMALYYAGDQTPIINTSRCIFRILDEAATTQLSICVNPNHGISVYRGATLIGTSDTGIVPASGWFYIELKVVIDNSAGEVTVRIGGTQVYSLTSADTRAGTAYVGAFRIGCIYPDEDTYYDDLYVDDAGYHGNCHITTFYPDADGANTAFARSAGSNDYECVDDNPPNDDTDYIYSATVTEKSTFGITTGALGSVKGIQLNNRLKVDGLGARLVKPVVRSNSTDYAGGVFDPITDSWLFYPRIYETDPDDSNPWTQTKLEAAEFGLQIDT